MPVKCLSAILSMVSRWEFHTGSATTALLVFIRDCIDHSYIIISSSYIVFLGEILAERVGVV